MERDEVREYITNIAYWQQVRANVYNDDITIDNNTVLKFMFIGPPGSGKSSLANTLVRSLNPTHSGWQVMRTGAPAERLHSTLRFHNKLLVAHFDNLELIDSVGVDDLSPNNARIWYRILFGERITERDFRVLTAQMVDPEVLRVFLGDFGGEFQPSGVILCVKANIGLESEDWRVFKLFLEILHSSGFGLIVVITHQDFLENVETGKRKVVDDYEKMKRMLIGIVRTENLFEISSYQPYQEVRAETQEISIRIVKRLIQVTLLNLQRRVYNPENEKRLGGNNSSCLLL
eukprot:TRINITY_DN4314_c0_g1_i1.p1 TRINITY_DN4314_c0_g1~~TRINITY_DN4314_c0_g1_i1.p1  ORF type:complete len:289 (-),score=68.57 TRINITY_DN4314_c0_g1_i1:38-904(-)